MRTWNKENIIQEVLELSKCLELRPKYVKAEYPSLLSAAIRHFGSWKSAVEGSGLDYSSIEKKKTIKKCSKCGEMGRIHDLSNMLCKKCYRPPEEGCGICGIIRSVNTRKNGVPICSTCYKTPEEMCSVCGKIRNVCKREDNFVICEKCYRPPKRKCSICGETGIIYKIDEDGHMCRKCYDQPKKKCSICGEIRVVCSYEKENPICDKCYRPPQRECSICGEIWRISKKDGDICSKCYVISYGQPERECSGCKKIKKIILNNNGSSLCDVCYKKWRYENDPNYRIKCRLRARLLEVFSLYSFTGKIRKSSDYGIDYEAIIKYLGSCPGERSQYHIDHIRPLSLFDFNDREQIKQAFAPENHQWLKAVDNLRKSNNYQGE